jgi:hypothetical protein
MCTPHQSVKNGIHQMNHVHVKIYQFKLLKKELERIFC